MNFCFSEIGKDSGKLTADYSRSENYETLGKLFQRTDAIAGHDDILVNCN